MISITQELHAINHHKIKCHQGNLAHNRKEKLLKNQYCAHRKGNEDYSFTGQMSDI